MKKFKIFKFSLLFLVFTSKTYAASNKVLLKEKLTTTLNLKEIFFASPVIYSTLIILSVVAFSIWMYCIFTFRISKNMSPKAINDLKNYLVKKEFSKATTYCHSSKTLFTNLISTGIHAKDHGPEHISNSMKAQGSRFTTKFWQRIGLLNDIVVVAPMLGLLGTVIGMFYAFYDINRSIDSIASLFDGLGIAIGTTVAGLVVAIIAMIFHATLKFRLIKMLNAVENEAVSMANLMFCKKRAK
ncbi:MAG: MotA/TolQ/ExbB proton channel family protein [Parachlamydiales bacterium]|nr:MotA/TolQ/ExbB proton channel family protein [Parachlamydiales bacterium]